jgi:hypothetical protein
MTKAMRTNSMSSRLSLVIVLVVSVCCVSGSGDRADTRPRDYVAQIATVANMRLIKDYIDLYREDHHMDPASLSTLMKEYRFRSDLLLDGWNRKFYYYTNGQSYVLASFGKVGTPSPQSSVPGGVAPPNRVSDYNVNIVMVNGDWAQFPVGVDR